MPAIDGVFQQCFKRQSLRYLEGSSFKIPQTLPLKTVLENAVDGRHCGAEIARWFSVTSKAFGNLEIQGGLFTMKELVDRQWMRLSLALLQASPFCNIDCKYCYLPNRSSV